MQIFPDLSVDARKVHAYLTIKKRIDPSYSSIAVISVESSVVDLQSIMDDIVDFALVSDDPVAMLLERDAQSDIAKPDFDPTHECGSGCEHDESINTIQQDLGSSASLDSTASVIPMDNIFIARRPEGTLPSNIEILRQLRQQTTEQSDTLPLVVAETPINEFQRNHVLFLGSFAHLFLLGEGVQRSKGTFNKREIQHLLLQHSNRFAKCAAFVFVAFNQMQRHDVIRQVSIRVKNNHHDMTAFDALVNDPTFVDRINDAIANPESENTKQLCSTVMGITRITGANVRYSAMERRSELSKMLAMMYYSGPFSFFVTIAPADLESRFIMRLSRHRTNNRLPQQSDLCKEDEDIVFTTGALPSLAVRRAMLASNPVAAAVVYKKQIECMLEHLVGLAASHTTRSNAPCMDERKEGAFGKPICFSGVHEVCLSFTLVCKFLIML